MPSGELDGGSLGFVGFTIDPAATGEAHESLFHTVLTRIVLQAYKPNSNWPVLCFYSLKDTLFLPELQVPPDLQDISAAVFTMSHT